MDVGLAIRLLRMESRMKQKELAQRLAISQAQVSDWERNIKLPPMKHFLKLPEIFKVSIVVTANELFSRKDYQVE